MDADILKIDVQTYPIRYNRQLKQFLRKGFKANALKMFASQLGIDSHSYGASSLSLSTNSMKETGLSSRIPRLHHRISTENISTKPTLSPHTIPEISLNSGEDDSGYGGSQTGLNPGRLRRHHSICVQRDKTTGTTKLGSSNVNVSRTSSPIAGDIYKNRSPNSVKRHKSFSGGETTPSGLHRYKNLSPNKSFNTGSRTSITAPSPVQIVKSSSRGNSSLDIRYESTPSPSLSRFKSNELLLSAENTPSPGCLSRRNTYHSLITSDESHVVSTDLKRRNSFQEILKQDGIQLNRPSVKTKSVYDPGRVQVFVRVRPPNDSEDTSKYPLAVSVPDEEETQLKLFDGKNDRCYQFDGILHDTATNKEVYKTVGEPLVYSALSGFNGILMCYGQTGTGKTYTLMSNDGMSVRIVYQCFKVLNKDKRHKYTVTCSYLQIYQEKIFDLLNETRTIELSLREHPKTGVYIENLTEYVVHSPKEVLDLLKVGKRRLVFAETKMNRASSRSHAICQLKILKERIGNDSGSTQASPPLYVQTPELLDDDDEFFDSHDQLGQSINESYQQMLTDDEDDEDILSNVPELEDGVTSVRGKLYICDLAGSERIKKTKASGERLQEAQHINSSLLELGNVIQALAEGKRSHVPFRNSTLTRLLQEGLSGNCKTRLVVCVAPTVKDVHETKCSLNFGSRAMKIQVMAHVNYEVDYKKLAEALAAKLENLEQEWNLQKQNYDKFIKQLKNEIDTRRSLSPMENLIIGVKSPAKHVQSLLVIELMTLQLFYNLQSNWPHQKKSNMITPDIPFTPSNLDMMLQSMEGLLELLSDYLRDRIPFRSKNYSMSSGCSSVITSPDCIDQSVSSTYDVPATLEPVARFLEHSQIRSANSQSNLDKSGDLLVEQNSKERLRRVINSLWQMKDMVNKKAVSALKDTFDGSLDSKEKINSLEEIVNHLDGQKDMMSSMESLDDIQSLENSLYYLLMDKALLSCMVLLKSQSNKLIDGFSSTTTASTNNSTKLDNCEPEIKRILEELEIERSARDKVQIELYSLREDQMLSDEKLKDAEMELKSVRELRDSLEMKLRAVESKNVILEEQIEKYKKEKDTLENRLEEIEKRKIQLEASLKNSDNNNARKERSIVDLKNEKVALESLVSTLKEEITILEKERTRENDEKRRIEEELEDVRDRNIILETEWSCCREENGLLETELTALEEDKAILEDELLKYRDDVKMLEEAVNMLEAQASDYKQDILSLKAKEERLLSNVRVEKEKFNKEINGLKQEMSTLRLERRRFQRDISVSRTDKSNTERAYNALKAQKDSLQEDITLFKQEEKRLQREISTLKSDRAKLEREIHSLKNENSKLKQDISHADKIKVELKLLQKNEDKIATAFKIERDRLYENLISFKEKYDRMEQDFTKVTNEKDKLTKQLKRYEQTIHDKNEANVVRRSQSQPTNPKSLTPEKNKMKQCSSVQGALVRRSVTSGEVSEVEGKVLDLQRRLAFFMTEKEDIQKELLTTRERNTNLTTELKTLETDTSKIQQLLSKLSDEKETLQTKLNRTSMSKDILEQEQIELKKAVSSAHAITEQLRTELDEVSEQNRVLEVDYLTIKESAKMLQGERVVLTTENEHIKKEFQNMDNELKQTRSMVQEFNTKLADLKKQVKEANDKEVNLNEKVAFLETENMSLTEQVSVCQHEEEMLIQQLAGLNEKFGSLESTVEHLLVQKSNEDNGVADEIMLQMKQLKSENKLLEDTVSDLKTQLETVVMDAEYLKEEQEEIEKVIQDDEEIIKDRESGTEKSLADNIRNLWIQLQTVKSEKQKIQEKMEEVEKQFETLGQENETLSQSMQEKSLRLEKEKRNYQMHIDKLQKQIEELIKERLQLEAEMEFLKSQNDELRRGIQVLLEDNSKLEAELEVVEEEFEKQEKELDTATEETKVLLRQLCVAETKNLNLCTVQSNHQEDLDQWKKQIEKLKKEKEDAAQKHLESEKKQKTLQERLLMAELEISKLKSEHASVEGQRRLLVDDLDAADRERTLLKSELHGLARALSPLKKEVTEVIKKQENLRTEVDSKAYHDISGEVARIKDELSSFNAEKSQLEMEQCELEVKLKSVSLEKEDLRIKLRALIQDLDQQTKSPTMENLSEIAEPIQIVSRLISEKQELELEEKILADDLIDAHYNNNILNICLDNSNNELRCAQEQLCLATVDRLKLKDKSRNIEKSALELRGDTNGLRTGEECSPVDMCGAPRKSGISPLQHEVSKLKLDIEQFEKSQENILYEIRSLNNQLNVAENNLVNVIHFKTVIEKNLRQYKERNSKLETHLRVIFNDLIDMETHMVDSPSESAKVLLETLDLQKHFQSLEDDLRDTETRNTKLESRNRTLKEDASDLMERCAALQEEKQINTVSSGYIQESMDGQSSFIDEIQKEKASLVYEKSRLEAKLALYKDDKKRILKDFQRLSQGLGAYAKYNRELERKLQSFKVDLSELQKNTGYDLGEFGYTKPKTLVNDLTQSSRENSSHLLCEQCRDNLNRKFSGIDNNTQLLGDELLDCITDNLSIESAICNMLEQKGDLENELVAMETEYNLDSTLFNELRNSGLTWSGSQSSFDSECGKRAWPSGRISTRSKSMTSFSGESYPGFDHVPIIPPGRCHTALGIYSHHNPPSSMCSPPPNKKSPEKSTSLLLSDSNSPPVFVKSMTIRRNSEDSAGDCINDDILPPRSPSNSSTATTLPDRCTKRRNNNSNNRYQPNKYDENRNLKSCSRTLTNDDVDVDEDENENDKHAASVKKIIPGFFRKLRTSKRYKK